MDIRKLRADEIECRVATVKNTGVSLLLYKDARADMTILDEAVGPLGWKREHSRDNANCTVSIWSEAIGQWVSKEDTGKESFTEKEKGLASDSFKRACFNWGIGRELYTSPFIWISSSDCTIKETNRKDKYGNPVLTTYDKFRVTNIHYDEHGTIDGLAINNETTNKRVWLMRPETASAKKAKEKVNSES